ncbi:MAG: transcriptional regulator, partial [Pyrinomonadaceae bacterium]
MDHGNNDLREFGKFRLDAKKLVLWYKGEPVNLAPKEIELLAVLTETAGEVVPKTELLDKIWRDSFVEESNLSRHIYILRKTFKDFGESKDLIQTVPRRGYRFTGEVRRIENKDDGFIVEKHTHTRTLIEIEEERAANANVINKRFLESPRVYFAVASILLSAILAAVIVLSSGNNPSRASTVRIRSIAVLPFKT